jgi:hypothetical protein
MGKISFLKYDGMDLPSCLSIGWPRRKKEDNPQSRILMI